jgi:hypothetical protein
MVYIAVLCVVTRLACPIVGIIELGELFYRHGHWDTGKAEDRDLSPDFQEITNVIDRSVTRHQPYQQISVLGGQPDAVHQGNWMVSNHNACHLPVSLLSKQPPVSMPVLMRKLGDTIGG